MKNIMKVLVFSGVIGCFTYVSANSGSLVIPVDGYNSPSGLKIHKDVQMNRSTSGSPGSLAIGGSQNCKGYWDAKYNQCLKLINSSSTCSNGYKWSSRLSKCYKKISTRSASDCHTKGAYWDAKYNQCLHTKGGCPSGYKWSSRLSKCYQKIKF